MKRPVRATLGYCIVNWYLRFKVIKGHSFDSSYQIKMIIATIIGVLLIIYDDHCLLLSSPSRYKVISNFPLITLTFPTSLRVEAPCSP